MNIFKLVGGIGKSGVGMISNLIRLPQKLYHSPTLFGMSSMSKGFRGLALRAAPATVMGLSLAGMKAFGGLVLDQYSTDSPYNAYGYTPGASGPGRYPMEFSTVQRGYIDQYATGGLMFALHNLRKR